MTISTNLAGRGTDIRLGGATEERAEAVRALGGLFVLGTNRHESRRIDDQLRGRAGRQGDPGETQFFLAIDDDLMVRYGLTELLDPTDESIVAREIAREQEVAAVYENVPGVLFFVAVQPDGDFRFLSISSARRRASSPRPGRRRSAGTSWRANMASRLCAMPSGG